MYYNKVIFKFTRRGDVALKRKYKLLGIFLFLLIGIFSGNIYASEGINITEEIDIKDDEVVEYLASTNDDGYLKITQIVPNSQNVRMSTYIEDNKLLVSGVVRRGTFITIKVFNEDYEEEYELRSRGTFSQSMTIREGENKIIVNYNNERDEIEDYIMFTVTRAPEQSILAIKNFLVTPE